MRAKFKDFFMPHKKLMSNLYVYSIAAHTFIGGILGGKKLLDESIEQKRPTPHQALSATTGFALGGSVGTMIGIGSPAIYPLIVTNYAVNAVLGSYTENELNRKNNNKTHEREQD